MDTPAKSGAVRRKETISVILVSPPNERSPSRRMGIVTRVSKGFSFQSRSSRAKIQEGSHSTSSLNSASRPPRSQTNTIYILRRDRFRQYVKPGDTGRLHRRTATLASNCNILSSEPFLVGRPPDIGLNCGPSSVILVKLCAFLWI